MWISRKAGIGLAVAAVAIVGIVLTPSQGWADGGAGIRFPEIKLIYEDDEDETSEPERIEYSVPRSFEISTRFRLGFSASLYRHVDYTTSTVATEESTPTSTVFTTKYSYSGLINARPEYRYRWNFEGTEYVDDDDESEEEEPALTPVIPKIMYKFSTWVNFDTLETLDEEEESVKTPGFPLELTDEQRDDLNRAFEVFVRGKVRDRVARWLGDGVAEDFKKRFGYVEDSAGAEDQSGWRNERIYCGATCVGHYY